MVFMYECCRDCAPKVKAALQKTWKDAKITEQNSGSKITLNLSIGNPAKAPAGSLVETAFKAADKVAPHGIKPKDKSRGIYKCSKV